MAGAARARKLNRDVTAASKTKVSHVKVAAISFSVLCLLGVPGARADATISSVQQTLKDQGFYYGEVTGQKDADTTAAIRRYQIRHGLQITGELNAETQKALGLKGVAPAPAPAPARPAPPPAPSYGSPDDSPTTQRLPPAIEDGFGVQPPQAYAPAVSGLFRGTPYQTAPPDLQRQVIAGTQRLLAQRGYYRSGIDGQFGAGTEFALRAFQSRFGIEPSGRLNVETLAALGLLPGQRAPGITAPARRVLRPPPSYWAPGGERIYIPR